MRFVTVITVHVKTINIQNSLCDMLCSNIENLCDQNNYCIFENI